MLEMYKGLVNSPETTITNNINTTDTIIYVLDPARVPDELPNLMTLGTGTNAETVKVLSIDGNALTVQRGFQGVAKDWLAGTVIARNFTEYDYEALRHNIETLDGGKVDKIAGKGLSTEDYTTAEKTKLAGIATGANKITVNNTLTSTSTTEALSAAQGKVLKDAADAHLAEKVQDAPHGIGTIASQDYEEGIWTPDLIDASGNNNHTYVTQEGYYIKKGNELSLYGTIKLSAKDPNFGGIVRIIGFPFSIPSPNGLQYVVNIFWENIVKHSGVSDWTVGGRRRDYISFQLYNLGDSEGQNTVDGTQIQDNTLLIFNLIAILD